jgi:Mn-dependent DtxR family transcriptional regulator
MRADGALRGPHGFWSVQQLAQYMGVSTPTARDILHELEKWGALYVVPVRGDRGHRDTSERYMRVPK